MNYRWSIAPSQPALATELARQLALSPLLAQCLLNRGHSEAKAIARFLEPRLRDLADPFALPNMAAAVDRLFAARDRAEPLVIFGDYDVDGVTSTALLLEIFRALGWSVDFYLPHRMDEGYGLSQDGVENCLSKFPATKLLLAVDCGSTAVETISWLKQRGVDVLVLDHHQVSDPAPAALALVNPQLANRALSGQRSAVSDFTELCSAGLAFKLAHALVKRGREIQLPAALAYDVRPLLDLVALGTIADLVPLVGENRILVTAGLERLNSTRRPGLLALKAAAGIDGSIGTYEVGFQLGPRLNAAGRVENAAEALQLLLARDLSTAEPVARALDHRNRERQAIERTITTEVIGAIRARFDPARDFIIVEGQLLWHIGVVGIVASRVLREFFRPTFILGGDAQQWRGSGRSIEGFDIAAALRECDDLLVRHGGHAMAAGITITPENVAPFRERLNAIARRTLRPDQLQPVLKLDAEVMLRELTVERVEELDRLAPTGMGNPALQFCATGLRLHRPPLRMGREQQHLKLHVTDGNDIREAVWWNVPKEYAVPATFDLAFAPQINEFKGNRNVQMKVSDLRAA
ncbi:MAG: single-stranded-DNA-specific exonuclease RecJ [Verrucomicrobia bacterium]|nr:single-stranded-DNA-specific exonuclease RecJ [Verrucomicrobiota bacterium]